MKPLSDYTSDCILEALEYYMNAWKVGKVKQECVLREMKSYLKHLESGLKENVCPYCWGTGYKESEVEHDG